MATSKEKLLSLGNLSGANIGTFTNEHQQFLKKSNRSVTFQNVSSLQRHQQLKVMQLQQHRQELKERELAAQHYNRQLLQEFEEAQEMLSDMIVRTAAMKAIRLEYEHYLEDRAPSWEQQLKEKTQAAQKKRMEEYMKRSVKNIEGHKTKPFAEQPSLSNGPAETTHRGFASQGFSNSNQNSYLPSMHSSWLTQIGRTTNQFPAQVHSENQSTSQIPQSLPSTAHQYYSLRQYPLPWASILADYPCSWVSEAAGMPSEYEARGNQVYMEETPPERSEAQATAEEMHRTLSSISEKGSESRKSPFSQGLDVKPVRLSGEAAGSSESGRDSGQSREEKKQGGRQCSPLEYEICPSQVSRASSPIVIASNTLVKTSESSSFSEKGSNGSRGMRRKIGKQATVFPITENVTKEVTRNEGDGRQNTSSDESEVSSVKSKGVNVRRRPSRKSASCKVQRSQVEKSRSMQEGDDEVEEQQSSGSEEKGLGDDRDGKGDSSCEGKQLNSQKDEEQNDSDVKDDPSSSSSEKEEEIAVAVKHQSAKENEGELSDKMKNDSSERRKKDSAASQSEEMNEDDSEGSQDELESGMDSDKTEPEDKDSDSIIFPQENRHKKINAIPEVEEDLKEDSETEASEDETNESDDEDIEQLLAPQALMKIIEKDSTTDEKPKVFNMDIFQVDPDKVLDKDPSDSDEFDHFYD